MKLWWLSFCDASKPKGSQFLGACIVPGTDVASACREAYRRGCNPGGEVMAHPIYPSKASFLREDEIGVLFDRAKATSFDRDPRFMPS